MAIWTFTDEGLGNSTYLEHSGREAAVFEGSPRDWARSSGEPMERAG